MNFLQPYKKFANFSGRTSRKEYWSFSLFFSFVYLALYIIDIFTGNIEEEYGYGFISGVFVLVSILPYISILVRRLHDVNKSGLLALICIIPIVNIYLLRLTCLKGDEGDNEFGKPPVLASTKIRNNSIVLS